MVERKDSRHLSNNGHGVRELSLSASFLFSVRPRTTHSSHVILTEFAINLDENSISAAGKRVALEVPAIPR